MTAVLVVPVTVAVNCWLAAVGSDVVAGVMLTETTVTVTVADADLLGSAELVAVTVYVPAVFGAV